MASRAPDRTLIGLTDGYIDSNRHHSSFLINKVGGEPDWPPLISRRSPRCGRCGAPAAHVVQVYCPLEDSPYHRTLNLFACCRPDCSGLSESWSAFRSQCLEDQAGPQAPGRSAPPLVAPLSATDWCEAADDWGMEEGVEKPVQVHNEVAVVETGDGPPVQESDMSCQFEDLSLVESKDVLLFSPFFISVMEESDLCGEDEGLEHAQELLQDYQRREGVVVGGLEKSGCSGEEKYEKTRHGDAVFTRFMKTISLCPQQVLRYCWGGTPVFISKPPSNMAQLVSACSSCGGARTFELQLMPALVSLLQKEDSSSAAELEFGTVLVYTCKNSCWTSGSNSAVEEFCLVQPDPDQQLFK